MTKMKKNKMKKNEKKYLTRFMLFVYTLTRLQERLLPGGKGRRRGKPGRIREKLSGKRTAASCNPGKRWAPRRGALTPTGKLPGFQKG